MNKETIQVPVLEGNNDSLFGLQLQDNDLYGRTYIKETSAEKNSSAAKIFGNIKRSCNRLCDAFITHVNGVPVFSTTRATEQLTLLYDQWRKAKK